jgi:hypothetical protein
VAVLPSVCGQEMHNGYCPDAVALGIVVATYAGWRLQVFCAAPRIAQTVLQTSHKQRVNLDVLLWLGTGCGGKDCCLMTFHSKALTPLCVNPASLFQRRSLNH